MNTQFVIRLSVREKLSEPHIQELLNLLKKSKERRRSTQKQKGKVVDIELVPYYKLGIEKKNRTVDPKIFNNNTSNFSEKYNKKRWMDQRESI